MFDRNQGDYSVGAGEVRHEPVSDASRINSESVAD
jgi:hypothetical protein